MDGQRSIGIGNLVIVDAAADSAIAIGNSASVTGAHSISIGDQVIVSGTNSVGIGNAITVASDNDVFFGNSLTANIGGTVNWTATSDGRFKNNVQENVPGLNFIDQLRPVTYNFDPAKMASFMNGDDLPPHLIAAAQNKAQTSYTGFIAQEVEAAALNLDYDFSGVKIPADAEKDMYGIRYAEFVVPLVKATQELHQKIRTQEEIISEQKAVIDTYKAALEKLTNRVDALEVKSGHEQAASRLSVSK